MVVLYREGNGRAVIVDGLHKTGEAVPEIEIQRTLNRKAEFEASPTDRTARHDEWPEDVE